MCLYHLFEIFFISPYSCLHTNMLYDVNKIYSLLFYHNHIGTKSKPAFPNRIELNRIDMSSREFVMSRQRVLEAVPPTLSMNYF